MDIRGKHQWAVMMFIWRYRRIWTSKEKTHVLAVLKVQGRKAVLEGRDTDTKASPGKIRKDFHIRTAWSYSYGVILCEPHVTITSSIDINHTEIYPYVFSNAICARSMFKWPSQGCERLSSLKHHSRETSPGSLNVTKIDITIWMC